MSIDTATLELRIQRLFPDLDWDQAVVELLLEHAQRNLVKYRAMARQFEAKYDNDFETMRETVLTSEPAFEVEQDYFDWEMAVTGVVDMQEEIERLKQLRQGSC